MIFSILIIIIPFFIVLFFNKEKENPKLNIIKNNIVKIKKEDGSIKEIPFEEYIVGVVAAEMPAEFEMEALKAQAVAARSYVLKKMAQNKEYDVLTTTSDQVYIEDEELKNKWKDKYDTYLKKIKTAVSETSGEYITYNGEVIEAFFFSTSSGKTENSEDVFSSELPYLRSVESTWDSEVSPVFNDVLIITKDEFLKKLNLNDNDINFEILEETSGGSIKKIKINNQIFTGVEIRKKLGLKSANFTINKNNQNIEIKTKGYGHGVGMSQYGALAMAKKGYKYDEIIKYYYSGVEISKMEV